MTCTDNQGQLTSVEPVNTKKCVVYSKIRVPLCKGWQQGYSILHVPFTSVVTTGRQTIAIKTHKWGNTPLATRFTWIKERDKISHWNTCLLTIKYKRPPINSSLLPVKR